MYNCRLPAYLANEIAMRSRRFLAESEVEVAFDFDTNRGVADYIGAKTWAVDRFDRDVRWRMIEREGRAVFSFRKYPDALLFALSIDGAAIREAGEA